MARFLKVIAVLLLTGVLLIIYLLGTSDLKPREASLLSIILFIFSILATWIFSHFYSESTHSKAIQDVKDLYQSNLRTYALKASEKVNNLSKQLGILVVYLQQELDASDYDSAPEELLVKEERLEAAIQMINVLKSVNDTALSDWQGVIGDELNQQRRAREEQEQDLRKLWGRFTELEKEGLASKHEDASKLHSRIKALEDEISVLARSFLGSSIRIRKPKTTRQNVESECPVCGAQLKYRQRPHERSLKVLKCSSCQTQLISRFDMIEGFKVEARRRLEETYACPECGTEGKIELDIIPGASATTDCEKCHARLRVTRRWDAPTITAVAAGDSEGTLDEKTIKAVQEALPPQPWPKGTSKAIGKTLGIPQSTVSRAVTELIRRGAFKPQIDGKLYSVEAGIAAPESAQGGKQVARGS